jgi:creatinine amidohydrolase
MSAFLDTDATSAEVASALPRGLIAVLPIGACEQHGAHLPLTTDTVLASGIARRLAEATGAWLLPAVPYGDAWNNEGFAGTLSLGPDTLRTVIEDIGRGLNRLGVRGLVVLNGHFGNRGPIGLAARRLVAENALPVLHLDYPNLDNIAAEIATSQPAGPGFFHADEVETSMMLALAPGLVHMERAIAEYPDFPPTFGAEPMPLSDFSRSGVFGDPRPATALKGTQLVDRIAVEALRLAELWRKRHAI